MAYFCNRVVSKLEDPLSLTNCITFLGKFEINFWISLEAIGCISGLGYVLLILYFTFQVSHRKKRSRQWVISYQVFWHHHFHLWVNLISLTYNTLYYGQRSAPLHSGAKEWASLLPRKSFLQKTRVSSLYKANLLLISLLNPFRIDCHIAAPVGWALL